MKKKYVMLLLFIFLYAINPLHSYASEKFAYWTLGGNYVDDENNIVVITLLEEISGCSEEKIMNAIDDENNQCNIYNYLKYAKFIDISKNSFSLQNELVSFGINETIENQDIYTFDLSKNKDGSVMAYIIKKKVLFIVSDGKLVLNEDSSFLFDENNALTIIRGFDNIDTSEVKNMSGMFRNTSLIELDINAIDTSSVTDMGWMFEGTQFNELNLNHFDTSKVTNMGCMFCYMNKLESLKINNFNTNNVIDMDLMFGGTSKLSSLDLSNFDTSKVEDMSSMFEGSTNLEVIKVSNSFVTTNVNESNDMFKNCNKIIGMNGTKYTSNKNNKEYARIDSNNNPGYFSNTLTDIFEISVNPSIELYAGQESDLDIQVLPTYLSNSVTLLSSNEDVVSINSNGKVVGVDRGNAIITVGTTLNGNSSNCSVIVHSLGKVISSEYHYDGNFYLNDSGDLYISGNVIGDSYATFYRSGIKKVLGGWYVYFLTDDDKLYGYTSSLKFIEDDIVDFVGRLSSNPKYYTLSKEGIVVFHRDYASYTPIQLNVANIQSIYYYDPADCYVYALDKDDRLYKINACNNETEKVFYNVLTFENGFILLKNGDLQYDNPYLEDSISVVSNVKELLKNEEWVRESTGRHSINYITNDNVLNSVVVNASDKKIDKLFNHSFMLIDGYDKFISDGKLYINGNIYNDGFLHDEYHGQLVSNNVKTATNDMFITNENELYSYDNNGNTILLMKNVKTFLDGGVITLSGNYYKKGTNDAGGRAGVGSLTSNLKDLHRVTTKYSKNKADSIVINDREIIIDDINKNVTINPKIYPLEYSEGIVWTSSNESIAIVDSNGKITSTGKGVATITATLSNGISDSFEVTVLEPKVLSIITSNDAYSVDLNDNTFRIEYSLETQDNPNYNVTMSSNNPNVATVNNDGLVTLNDIGTVEITITAGSTEKKITINIFCTINGVTLNERELTLVLGSTSNLEATINPSTATEDKTLIWTSSDENVVTVDQNGKVTAVGFGSAIIVVRTQNNKEARCYVYVDSKVLKPTITISSINNNVTLTWEEKINATSYEIYRSNDKKKWSKVGTVTTNSFTNGGLAYGKTYYYKVIAKNKVSKSGYSNIVGKKIVPNKVTLSIKSAGTNNVKIGYEKVSTTGYQVQRSTNSKKWSTVKTITKNSTLEFNNKKLKANSTYYYRVRAYKTVKGKKIYGPWSNVVSTKTAPVKPGLKLSLHDLESIDYNITYSKGASNYIVEESLDGKTYSISFSVSEAKTYRMESLEFGKTYYFRIKACNTENRCSGWTTGSLILTTKTPSISLKTSSKKVTVTLGSVDGADGYEVYRSNYSNKKFSLVKSLTSPGDLTFDNGTKKGKTYYYKVRSYKVVGDAKVYSPYSSVKKIKSK